MAKILVTGAGGFIGSHIVELALREGHQVRATDVKLDMLSRAKEAGAEILESDLRIPMSLQKPIEGIETVVHNAGIFDFSVKRREMEAVNVEGVHNMCREAKRAGAKRFVYISTVGVYGLPKSIPCKEDTEKRPRNNYEQTKWLGEQAAFEHYKEHALPVTALRPTLVYGERSQYGHAMMIGALSLLKRRGRKKIPLLRGGPLTHSVHVEDVARAALFLCTAENVVGKSFNIADDTWVKLGDFLGAMMEPLGIGVLFRYPLLIPKWAVRPWGLGMLNKRIKKGWQHLIEKGEIKPVLKVRIDDDWLGYFRGDHCYDTSAIKSLGFQLKNPDFHKGIAETVQWYKAEKWIPG